MTIKMSALYIAMPVFTTLQRQKRVSMRGITGSAVIPQHMGFLDFVQAET
jgi:hypothetical protein